jgi:hypothetical protein
MSSKRHKKRKAPTAVPKAPSLPIKPRALTLSGVLGLILTAVGALGVVELRPQLSVAPQEQLAVGQPFSAPFEITNTGYLRIHIENVIVVFHTVEVQGSTFEDATTGNLTWDNFDLDRGKSKTILPYFTNGMPTKADVIIAIDYKFLGKKWRTFSRFQGMHMDKWAWSKQPVGELEPKMNDVTHVALRKHRQANTHIGLN